MSEPILAETAELMALARERYTFPQFVAYCTSGCGWAATYRTRASAQLAMHRHTCPAPTDTPTHQTTGDAA